MLNEADRLNEVRSFRAVASVDSPALRQATALAAHLFRCPISTVNLIDDGHQWLLGRTGLDVCSTDRDLAFCTLTLDLPPRSVMVVENAALDPRFCDNPLVTGEPGIRFYAGAVLTTSDGFNLGALCIIDTVPRSRPTDAELANLQALADLVVAELERSRSERRRQQQQDMLNMAEAMSGVGHWRVQLPAGQVFWSDEVYAIYGLDPENHSPQYMDALSFYDPADARILTAAIADATGGRGPFELELGFTRKDGVARRVIAKGACAFDMDGQPALLYGVFQDATEYRAAIAAAQDAAAVKAEFLANMSHELRTPLTSIIGFTNLTLTQPDLSDATRDYVRRIENAGTSLLSLVNDILDFSKLEAGQVAIRPEPVDIERLCHDVLELFQPQVGAKDIKLDLEVRPVGLRLIIDPDRVRQILLNLVSNAVKFTEVGQVRLAMTWVDGQLTGAVSDTGPGMPADQLDRLFQRFSQIDGAGARNAGGTGLGLAICKGLSEAMGGRAGAESTLGAGSRFWFEIAADRIETSVPVMLTGEPAESPLSPTLDGLQILVADDHPANRELARLFLSGFGAEIVQAEDGLQAVEMASRQRYDLILMDIRMPRLDGAKALATIREDGASRMTPILAYTADGDEADASIWLAKGFAGVVPKPLSAHQLIRVVTCALARPALPLDGIATG